MDMNWGVLIFTNLYLSPEKNLPQNLISRMKVEASNMMESTFQ